MAQRPIARLVCVAEPTTTIRLVTTLRFSQLPASDPTTGQCFPHYEPDTRVQYSLMHSDAPISLIGATLEAIPILAGTKEEGFSWTIYTGDLVSHDSENQLSRDYVSYAEVCLLTFTRHAWTRADGLASGLDV